MRKSSTLLLAGACLLAGFGAGLLVPDRGLSGATGPVRGATKTPTSAPKPLREVDDSGQPSTVAAGAPAEVPAEEEAADGRVVVSAELLEQLSLTAGARTADQELFSRDGKLEALLQIEDHEKAALQTAWRESRARVEALEAAAAQAEDLEDGAVRITVPDLADQVAGVGESFRTTARTILGTNRGEVFTAMKQTGRALGHRSGGERTYLVSAEATGDGGWRFRTELQSPDGNRVWVGESIPNELRHLTDAVHIIPTLEEGGTTDEVCGE